MNESVTIHFIASIQFQTGLSTDRFYTTDKAFVKMLTEYTADNAELPERIVFGDVHITKYNIAAIEFNSVDDKMRAKRVNENPSEL